MKYEVLVDDVINGQVRSGEGYDFADVEADSAEEALHKAREVASNPNCYALAKTGQYEFMVEVRNREDVADNAALSVTVHYTNPEDVQNYYDALNEADEEKAEHCPQKKRAA